MKGRVLVVEDDLDWVDTYRDWLEPEGYSLRHANGIEDALTAAADWVPHVVLVDQRLEGPGGRDLGLSLLRRIADTCPTARTLLVTGFATNEAVNRAFSNGASDYLEKTEPLEALLRAKLPDLVAASERALGEEDRGAQEAALTEAWKRARTDTNPQAKGAALEETVKRIFESIPGFAHARTNASNRLEEIDVLVTNRSADPFLGRQGDFIVVECKNWSASVGVPEVDRLLSKLRNRYDRSRLGLCVAMNGFSTTVAEYLRGKGHGDHPILLLDQAAIDDWLAAAKRGDWLIERIEAAVTA